MPCTTRQYLAGCWNNPVKESIKRKVTNRQYDYQEQFDFYYQAFGLTIGSGIEIPELLPAEGEGKPDVVIQPGIVPDELKNPKKTGVRFQVKPGHFLLKVDNIARFYVSNGRRVVVERLPGAGGAEVRLFLLGSVLAALLHQRKQLPLHASAIKANDKCVIFCGASGHGKSTIAQAFVKRGYHLHADDICVITLDKDDRPLVYPGYPSLKLWEDSLLKTGENPSIYPRIREKIKKFAVTARDRFNLKPLPIKKIYVLSPYNKSDIEISELSGMKKFNALRSQTYRCKFVNGLGNEAIHFKITGLVGKQVPLFLVYRPLKQFLLKELSDVLEEDFLR